MQKNAEWGEFLPVAGVDRAAVFHRETPRVSYVKRLVDQIEMGGEQSDPLTALVCWM